MATIWASEFVVNPRFLSSLNAARTAKSRHISFLHPSPLSKSFPCLQTLSPAKTASRRGETLVSSSSSKPSSAEISPAEEEWLKKLLDKKKPLYSHSLPCIEAWLRSLGFYQSRDDRALWLVEKTGWQAHLALDVTDLYIRYLKSGPGNLEKDIERRFSYALSREDIENAILGGP